METLRTLGRTEAGDAEEAVPPLLLSWERRRGDGSSSQTPALNDPCQGSGGTTVGLGEGEYPTLAGALGPPYESGGRAEAQS